MDHKFVAIVHSAEHAFWVSVEQIRDNLMSAYSAYLSKKDYQIISVNYNKLTSGSELLKMMDELHQQKVEKIIFLDDYPPPCQFLEKFIKRYPDYDGEFYIHIYGSFLIRIQDWYHLNQFMLGKKVRFIVSSKAHKDFLDTFLEMNNHTYVCPSPVLRQAYQCDESIRNHARSKMNLKDDFVFFYSGRMSLQKNIEMACRAILEEADIAGKKVKILLAGLFDDHGAPFFRVNVPTGHYFAKWTEFINSLPDVYQEKIQFLNFLEKTDLVAALNAADCAINLSTFHMENYGIGPLEALCCGTPAILTAWGGFISFANIDHQVCQLVDVNIEKNGLIINEDILRKTIQFMMQNPLSISDRKACAQKYLDAYSIESMGSYLNPIFDDNPTPFTGFGFKLKVLMKSLEMGFEAPSSQSFYGDIFKSYLRPSSFEE